MCIILMSVDEWSNYVLQLVSYIQLTVPGRCGMRAATLIIQANKMSNL